MNLEKALKREKKNHLKSLINHYQDLMEQGHTFWFCSSRDEDKGRPFYYVQIHRSEHMATCSTCQKLMELKNKIRKLQAEIGVEQWPLRWNIKKDEYKPRLSVQNASDFNPNYVYLR